MPAVVPASDLAGPGLDRDRLSAAVGDVFQILAVAPSTASTNDDAAVWLASGGCSTALGAVFAADHQSGGRGRLGRVWTAPARTSVAVSVVLRPTVPASTWGWLPLLAGQAVREAVAAVVGDVVAADPGTVRVKWPNDVVIRGGDGTAGDGTVTGKVSGLLCEVRGDAVVVGAGINTNFTAAERPASGATSLRLVAGRVVDPTAIVLGYLSALARWWRAWSATLGDAEACGLLAAHLRHSDTVGRLVRVAVPGGGLVVGKAVTIDPDGRLVVEADGVRSILGAGDVVHVR